MILSFVLFIIFGLIMFFGICRQRDDIVDTAFIVCNVWAAAYVIIRVLT